MPTPKDSSAKASGQEWAVGLRSSQEEGRYGRSQGGGGAEEEGREVAVGQMLQSLVGHGQDFGG